MRISFDVSEETAIILHDRIPYGIRKYVYKTLIEGLATKLTQDPAKTLASLITKAWDLDELLNLSLSQGVKDVRPGNKQE
jgi:hypothetical protein